jgi:spoIIIJ-associated protein
VAGPPEVGEPSEPSVAQVRSPLSPLGEFVRGVIERMDIGPFEISESAQGEAGELRVCQLAGPAAERLAGGDGRVADAIQLLGNQAALRIDEGNQRLVLEIEGDTEARESLLSRAAERAAQRATTTGRAVALEAMSPRDRRVIHMALREMKGIATMSIGDGRFRQVVVVPEGAPEYDQAVDYEAAAAANRGSEE